MLNFFVSDLFFLHAAGAVLAFRAAAAVVPRWARQLLLLLISVYFLSWLANFRALGPFLLLYAVAALAVGQAFVWVKPAARGALLGAGCAICLTTLIVLKYQSLLPGVGELGSRIARLRTIEWVGLSYLTFRTLDYLVSAQASPVDTAGPGWLTNCSYLLFFPAFVSGPINRYGQYLDDQARDCQPLTLVRARANLLRIATGVTKILLFGRLAYSYSVLAPEFPGLSVVSIPALALALYAFYFYFYLDFSGYCDVAIGLADFFEVRLPENFNYPLLATSPQDFWNRWHISLTQWLRDFVFFPLLRFFAVRLPVVPELPAVMVSSFLTLVLVGAWHGSALNWALYGCYHGLGLCAHLAYKHVLESRWPEFADRLRDAWPYRTLCSVLVFNYVAWGLLLTLPLNTLRPLLARAFG